MVNDWLRSEVPDIRKTPEVAERPQHLSKLPSIGTCALNNAPALKA